MKKIKILKKTSVILLGALGLSSLLSSCNKEKDCNCNSTSTTTGGGSIFTDAETYTVTTNEKCVELNRSVTRTDTYSGYYGNSYTVTNVTTIECD